MAWLSLSALFRPIRGSTDLLQPGAPWLAEKRNTTISLQWFVVIGTSYLALFRKGTVSEDPRVLLLVAVLMLSILALRRLPESAFGSRFFNPAVIVGDTILILFAIGLNRDTPWDLFLLFFFCLFIAGIGESLVQIVSGCLLLSIAFTFFAFPQSADAPVYDAEMLLRIPFIFGVSILYGYLADQVKKEKRRADQAEQTEATKRRLVSALAHDIKSPLSLILGYADTVAANVAAGANREENLMSMNRIRSNAERIVKLVTSFLDASKAEAGRGGAVRASVQVNRLIREAGRQHVGQLAGKNLSLELDLDERLPEILGNEAELERALWNLVGNAIKFTPRGGAITVTSRVDDNHVCIGVKDTGPGIPPEETPLLFSEFRRLRGAADIEGSGLGLFIVKTIVEGHGGAAEVKSDLGRGTTFTLRFPVRG